MKATATRSFMRGEDEVRAGTTFECSPAEFNKWAALGFIQPYETKVEAPAEAKKPGKSAPGAASQPARASRKKTAKKSAKRASK